MSHLSYAVGKLNELASQKGANARGMKSLRDISLMRENSSRSICANNRTTDRLLFQLSPKRIKLRNEK